MTTRSRRPATTAGIYVRISSDPDGTELGVRRQRNDCEALAAHLNWRVADVYVDNDTSASNGKPRPEYERMVGDIASGRINAVVVWDVDRLTRTPRELEDVIDFADRAGLRLASVGGDIDLSTEQGRMMARMKGTVARYEIEQSRRRLRAKHAELAAAGKHIGPRPYGWDMTTVDGETVLTINKSEAAVIRECVRRVLSGEGLWKIRNDLNERGVLTSTGSSWQTQTLRRMLLRWRNCGVRTHRGKEAGPGVWEPIIDRDTHERVVTTLTNPSRKANNRGTAVRYLLTGIARCGACGRSLVGTNEFTYEVKVKPLAGTTESRTKTRHYPHAYKCPHAGCMKVQRPQAGIDELVSGVVVEKLTREGVRLLGGDQAVAAEAESRVEALKAKLDLAADRWSADEISDSQFARITARLRPELEEEQARYRRAMPEQSIDRFVGTSATEAWAAADVEQKRQVLRRLMAMTGLRVTVDQLGSGRGGAGTDINNVRIEWGTDDGTKTWW